MTATAPVMLLHQATTWLLGAALAISVGRRRETDRLNDGFERSLRVGVALCTALAAPALWTASYDADVGLIAATFTAAAVGWGLLQPPAAIAVWSEAHLLAAQTFGALVAMNGALLASEGLGPPLPAWLWQGALAPVVALYARRAPLPRAIALGWAAAGMFGAAATVAAVFAADHPALHRLPWIWLPTVSLPAVAAMHAVGFRSALRRGAGDALAT